MNAANKKTDTNQSTANTNISNLFLWATMPLQ